LKAASSSLDSAATSGPECAFKSGSSGLPQEDALRSDNINYPSIYGGESLPGNALQNQTVPHAPATGIPPLPNPAEVPLESIVLCQPQISTDSTIEAASTDPGPSASNHSRYSPTPFDPVEIGLYERGPPWYTFGTTPGSHTVLDDALIEGQSNAFKEFINDFHRPDSRHCDIKSKKFQPTFDCCIDWMSGTGFRQYQGGHGLIQSICAVNYRYIEIGVMYRGR
jgi:hypothetical protein